MAIVRVNTSDIEFIRRRGLLEPASIGTDIAGVMYFTTDVRVPSFERTTFAGADMIRFDLGPDKPRDHQAAAMYPAHYLVNAEEDR